MSQQQDEQRLEPLVEEQARGGTTEDKLTPSAQQGDTGTQGQGSEPGMQRLAQEQTRGVTEDKTG